MLPRVIVDEMVPVVGVTGAGAGTLRLLHHARRMLSTKDIVDSDDRLIAAPFFGFED